jgi:4-hydroxy-tetrahydrodipicolinate reductase
MTKIALLGRGKTGQKVLEVKNQESITVFHRDNLPTYDLLKDHDVILSFLPGDAFAQLIPLLVETKRPVVTGSTGFSWPPGLKEELLKNNLTWVHASNFALGMNLVKEMITLLGKADHIFKNDLKFDIHEVHHTKKVDAPSGTALSWKEWLGHEAIITSERTGDVVGDHKITLNTPFESISLGHVAHDRKIFAQGALWACSKILEQKWKAGLWSFSELVRKELLG